MLNKIIIPLFIVQIVTGQAFSQEIRRPNVVIIFADDMGYGDVSDLNPDARTRTPNIDYLIAHGISFSEAHASASVCTPSRYGLLTGRYAFRQEAARRGINGFDAPVIEEGRQTLGNIFRASGYTTACIGKWHLGVGWQTKDGADVEYSHKTGKTNVDYSLPILSGPNDFGFDYSFIHTASLDMPPYLFIENHKVVDEDIIVTSSVYPSELETTEYSWDKMHTREGDVYWRKGVWWRKGEMSKSFRIETCLSEVMNKGTEYIRSKKDRESSRPFFLYLPLTGPHTPWMPADKFQGLSPIGDYGDFILNVDYVVGEVVAALKDIGELNNTIIVFSSDNGAYWPEEEVALQEHDSHGGRRGQKGDIWDGGHRIPLIVHWPEGIKKAFEYDGLTSLTDWYATFSDLLGHKMNTDEGEDSYSFFSVLKNHKTDKHRTTMIHHSSRGVFAYRKGKWKFIDGLGSGGFTIPSSIEPGDDGIRGQLYDLSEDSGESHNEYAQKPRLVKDLREEMKQQIEMGRSR